MKTFLQTCSFFRLSSQTLSRFLLACFLAHFSFSAHANTSVSVVTSFTILADMTRQVGGDRIKVYSLVGENSDAHAFQPSPSDAKRLGAADLVIINGLGFEGWIERLVRASGYRGKVVVATTGIKPIDAPHGHSHAGHGHDHKHDHKHNHEHNHKHGHDHEIDPHAWQDAGNALRYVDNIAAALSEADPAGKTIYADNAARYKAQISALDAAIRQTFAAIPEARRRVVTTHDAFAYFGRAYGVKFFAPLGVNSEAEPSAREIGWLIRQIRQEGIPAVFMENISDSRMIERIRQESGARMGGTLYSDSLSGSDGPAASYLRMMRHNVDTLSAALRE